MDSLVAWIQGGGATMFVLVACGIIAPVALLADGVLLVLRRRVPAVFTIGLAALIVAIGLLGTGLGLQQGRMAIRQASLEVQPTLAAMALMYGSIPRYAAELLAGSVLAMGAVARIVASIAVPALPTTWTPRRAVLVVMAGLAGAGAVGVFGLSIPRPPAIGALPIAGAVLGLIVTGGLALTTLRSIATSADGPRALAVRQGAAVLAVLAVISLGAGTVHGITVELDAVARASAEQSTYFLAKFLDHERSALFGTALACGAVLPAAVMVLWSPPRRLDRQAALWTAIATLVVGGIVVGEALVARQAHALRDLSPASAVWSTLDTTIHLPKPGAHRTSITPGCAVLRDDRGWRTLPLVPSAPCTAGPLTVPVPEGPVLLVLDADMPAADLGAVAWGSESAELHVLTHWPNPLAPPELGYSATPLQWLPTPPSVDTDLYLLADLPEGDHLGRHPRDFQLVLDDDLEDALILRGGPDTVLVLVPGSRWTVQDLIDRCLAPEVFAACIVMPPHV